MSVTAVPAVFALALLQGALVALPKADALATLRRLHSPAWAFVLPGFIALGTLILSLLHSGPTDLLTLAAVATPLLAAIAVLGVVRRDLLWALAAGLLLAGVGACLSAWVRELSASMLTALGCLTLGAAVVRLVPPRWALVGVLTMCALDAALMLLGPGVSTVSLMRSADAHFHGPLLDGAQVGTVATDYPDLMLAAAIGGFVAGHPCQRRAAVLVSVLVAGFDMLLFVFHTVPATVPLALAFVLARFVRVPERLRWSRSFERRTRAVRVRLATLTATAAVTAVAGLAVTTAPAGAETYDLSTETPWARDLAPSGVCAGDTDATSSSAVREQAMMCLINWARRRAHLRALTPDDQLHDTAVMKIRSMVACDAFSHSACGHPFTWWFDRSGYLPAPSFAVGENIAAAAGPDDSVRDTMLAWLNSPGHRANILSPAYRQQGIAVSDPRRFLGYTSMSVWSSEFGSRS